MRRLAAQIKRLERAGHQQRGAALVEAAMVTPILLLLINGMLIMVHALGHAPLLTQIAFNSFMAGTRSQLATRGDTMSQRVETLLEVSSGRFGQVSEGSSFPNSYHDTNDRTVNLTLAVDLLSLGGVSQGVYMEYGEYNPVTGEYETKLFEVRRRLTSVAWSLSGPLLLPTTAVDQNMVRFSDPLNVIYDCEGNRAQSEPSGC